MNRLLCGVAALLAAAAAPGAAPVAFDATVTAYENERFAPSRTSFQRMAEAGLPEAQFNLGVMTLNGQGGLADPVEAALWVRLAADAKYEPAMEAVEVLMEYLDGNQQSRYEQRLPEWRDRHARSALLERYRPETCESDCLEPADGDSPESTRMDVDASESKPADDVYITVDDKPLTADRTAPRYPRRATEQAISGRVILGGWITGTGELRHPHIVDGYPDDVFDQVAMDAWTSWRFDWPDGVPDSAPAYISQQIIFTLDSMKKGSTQRELSEAIEASEEDVDAAHKAVWMVEKLHLPLSEKARPDSVVSIISRAAEAGLVRAQHDLSDRQAHGDLVRQNRDAAIFWLKQAAFEGDARAQFELTRWNRLDDDFRSDLRRAAARQGFLPAVLWELREHVAGPQGQNPDYLRELLDHLPEDWPHGEDLIEQAHRRLVDS